MLLICFLEYSRTTERDDTLVYHAPTTRFFSRDEVTGDFECDAHPVVLFEYVDFSTFGGAMKEDMLTVIPKVQRNDVGLPFIAHGKMTDLRTANDIVNGLAVNYFSFGHSHRILLPDNIIIDLTFYSISQGRVIPTLFLLQLRKVYFPFPCLPPG